MVTLEQDRWPAERLTTLSKAELERLRQNASKYAITRVLELCDLELARRNAAKPAKQRSRATQKRDASVVIEFHFVCKGGRGVAEVDGSHFTSGSWVVSEEEVQRSLQHGALLALHETRSDLSYRQGRIVGYRLAERDMLGDNPEAPNTKFGIEFTVESTAEPLVWFGDATAEKGYRRLDLSGQPTKGNPT